MNELIEQFNQKLKLRYGNNPIVVDGIIDKELYKNAKFKILWILKEAWGTGFIYTNYFKEDFIFGKPFPESASMWHKITYTNNGILNEFIKWDNMNELTKDVKVYNSLKSCALVNLKKIPGGTKSHDDVIRSNYLEYKDLILEQIALINPDIIICGNTFKFIKDDFEIQKTIKTENANGHFSGNKLIVDAYHPSYFSFKQETYCDEIIEICNQWKGNLAS